MRRAGNGTTRACLRRATFRAFATFASSVMIEKFAGVGGKAMSEFLDLNHTSNSKFLVSRMIPKFAPDPSRKLWRTSESGH